tara:strand:+ start:32179 stop:32589 length:411 start_codon:yes stop_codon:yes gene_type:complete
MSKAIGIDFGLKRSGISISDTSQIIATPLITIDSNQIYNYLEQLFIDENINVIIIGSSVNLDGTPTDSSNIIIKFTKRLRTLYPLKKICNVDERYTSKIASRAIIDMGVKKKNRRIKSLIDKISATIILQDYLSYK